MDDKPQRFYKIGIIGYPLKQTLSPHIHQMFLKRAGLNGSYTVLPVTTEHLKEKISELRETGYDGFNVTYPHKRRVVEFCEMLKGDAKELGVVNTVFFRDNTIEGSNTDTTGFLRALMTVDANPPFFIVGSGGAARAVAFVLKRESLDFEVFCRTAPDWCASYANPVSELTDIDLAGGTVINATTLGWQNDDVFPIDTDELQDGLFFDLNYNSRWDWRNELEKNGIRVCTGMDMLVFQAAESFRIWTGIAPDVINWRDKHKFGGPDE